MQQDIEAGYRIEVAELLAKVQPTFALWRERGDNALLAAAQALPAMMLGLAAGVAAECRAPMRSNTPARTHSRKRSCTVLAEPIARGSAFHWQPVRRAY